MDRRSERENERKFLIGLAALLIAMTFIGFALYISPYLLWDLHYDVPEFVPDWLYWLQQKGALTPGGAAWALFFIFFMPGLIAGLFVYVTFNRIEQQKFLESSQETSHQQNASDTSWKESSKLLGQLLLLVAIIFLVARILEWLIASPVS